MSDVVEASSGGDQKTQLSKLDTLLSRTRLFANQQQQQPLGDNSKKRAESHSGRDSKNTQ
ncbi:MAG: hypothetical protein MHMPM18_004705 [Marteilia pararefringens]